MCHRWYIRYLAGTKKAGADFIPRSPYKLWRGGSMWHTCETDRPVKEGEVRPKEQAEHLSDF